MLAIHRVVIAHAPFCDDLALFIRRFARSSYERIQVPFAVQCSVAVTSFVILLLLQNFSFKSVETYSGKGFNSRVIQIDRLCFQADLGLIIVIVVILLHSIRPCLSHPAMETQC